MYIRKPGGITHVCVYVCVYVCRFPHYNWWSSLQTGDSTEILISFSLIIFKAICFMNYFNYMGFAFDSEVPLRSLRLSADSLKLITPGWVLQLIDMVCSGLLNTKLEVNQNQTGRTWVQITLTGRFYPLLRLSRLLTKSDLIERG